MVAVKRGKRGTRGDVDVYVEVNGVKDAVEDGDGNGISVVRDGAGRSGDYEVCLVSI